MKLILKTKALLDKSDTENIHQFSMKSRVSVATAYKHLTRADEIKALDTKVLMAFLVNGLELSKKEILEMRIGDLFEIVDK